MNSCTHSEFRILRAGKHTERLEWIKAWLAWPAREVFGHPAYLELFAEESAHAMCAYLNTGAGSVLYPFLRRPISGMLATDITSAYGYGGPAFWGCGDDTQIAAEFWSHFDKWAWEEDTVSEFIRFNPVQQSLDYPGTKTQKLLNVVRSLELDEDELWYDVKHKVRKNVKRARESNVAIEVDTEGKRLEEFLTIYYNTMNRRSTSSEYYFKREFFERIVETLPGQFAFFHACRDNKLISTELVLLSAKNAYSFLGGTDESSFELRPNDLLKYEIMLWAQAAGKQRFVLGGGKSLEDGIFKYKQAFAPSGVVPFFVGTRVLDHVAYENLVQSSGNDLSMSDAFFPVYRAA